MQLYKSDYFWKVLKSTLVKNLNFKMADNFEDKFKAELFKKYKACEKVLIPKEQYFSMIDQLKAVANTSKKKSRNGYYLLSK